MTQSTHKVDIREFRDRLSHHLGRVDRGEVVVITRRGRPIARLGPVEEADPVEELMHLDWVGGSQRAA